jgi:hypothetical protein
MNKDNKKPLSPHSRDIPESLLYANIKPNSRKYKKESKKIEKAHRLAAMPKSKFKRILYYLHPKNFFGFIVFPFLITSKCRWGPKQYPVHPD